jgi:hypothetical protein
VAISRVPIMAACAPSARAATSPRASPIPPAAAIGIGATASTTRGTNDWLGSNGNNHHLSAGDGNDWIGATGSGGTLDGGSGMTRSWASKTSIACSAVMARRMLPTRNDMPLTRCGAGHISDARQALRRGVPITSIQVVSSALT